jgi:hypothetical protein
VKDVFKNESRKAVLQSEAAQAILQGGKKFISESQLQEIKGGEDGSEASNKPLAQVLREQREAKEAAAQEKWKEIKRGKNRPLDQDEALFLESIAEAEAARLRNEVNEEHAELEAFHRALREQQERQAAARAATLAKGDDAEMQDATTSGRMAASSGKVHAQGKHRQRSVLPVARMVVVKPQSSASLQTDGSHAAAAEAAHPSKRQKLGQNIADGRQKSEEEDTGLAGLLGGYQSDSNDDGEPEDTHSDVFIVKK